MKHIVKQPEPQDFSSWKAAYPTAIFKNLGHDRLFPGAQRARWALRNSLVTEQGGLCCYCEIRIDNGDFHIEHFRPKDPGMFPHLQLAYTNLHACCRKNAAGGDDEYCGHKKHNDFFEGLVSPLDADCESRFRYDMSGKITGTDVNATDTVLLLNLNSKLLLKARKSLIEEFEDMDDDEYAAQIASHLDTSKYPLGEFYTVIRFLHNANMLH